jgi:hypothetical protein
VVGVAILVEVARRGKAMVEVVAIGVEIIAHEVVDAGKRYAVLGAEWCW